MDNQTLSIYTFTASLTEDQLDVCERDEEELKKIFAEGWSEANAVRFHRAMFAARRITPDATVAGVIELALSAGLSHVVDISTKNEKPKARQRRRANPRRVRGIGVNHGRPGVSITED